jgi:hypothetical protein
VDTNDSKAWAVARSIYTGANILAQHIPRKYSIEPFFLNDELVSFGPSKGLVFCKENLLLLHSSGFAFPELRFLLSNPLHALRKIFIINKIGYALKSHTKNKLLLSLLLGMGLEATSVYMNENQLCYEIIGGETGLVEFYLDGDKHPLASLYRREGCKWKVTLNPPRKNARVRISFENIDAGIKSCLGKLNPQVASALGQYTISGYLPLMDKIGYCARITGHELPILTS